MAEAVEQTAETTPEQLPEALRDRYVLEQQLPHGTHGPGWLLRDTSSYGYVVLRQLLAGSGEQPPGASLRETAAALDHTPEAVHVVEILDDNQSVWLTRQWVAGENLGEALNTLGSLTLEQSRALLVTVCRGLIGSGDTPVIHGNLRPENVLIETTGRIRVSDHGLRSAGVRRQGAETLSFLAPEVVAGGKPSHRSDVYALGAVLYASLCGQYPLAFTGDPKADVDVLHAHRVQPPPPSVRLPGALGSVIWHALQPSPDDRYPSALELLQALGQAGDLEQQAPRARFRLPFFGR